MYNQVLINTVVVVLIINIHRYQCTMTLQQQEQQFLPCGTKYLNQTIGLSIANNHLYQFILINKTIQVIQYDNRKLLIENNDYNNDENDDYKLNLINGQMLSNGLKDLIPANVAEKIMTVIQWTIEELKKYKDLHGIQEQQDNNLQPIISMSMSINKNGKIRIFCLKSFDQFIYIIGDYNQEIDMTTMEIFNVIYPEDLSIMGTISNQNDEIITFLYSKLSYQLKMIKLSEKQYGETNFEWIKSLVVDSDLKFLHEIHDEKPTEQQEETLTKSFGQIFGPHTFTYGFVSDNQIYLFANQNEKLITFSMNILKHKTNEKNEYPFEMKLYSKFFYCKSNENFDDFFTMEAITKITSKFETITNTSIIIINRFNITKSNQSNNNDNEHSFFLILYITLSVIFFLPLIIIMIIICYRNSKYHKKLAEKKQLQQSLSIRKYPVFYPQHSFYNDDNNNNQSIVSSSYSLTSPPLQQSLIQSKSPFSFVSTSTI